MKYIRIEERDNYKIYTTVESGGNYHSHVRYNDGTIGGCTSGNILGNGWRSLTEYFQNNPGFEVLE